MRHLLCVMMSLVLCHVITAATRAESLPVVRQRIDQVLDAAESSKDLALAARQLGGLFDQVIAHVPITETNTFVEVASARRLAAQLSQVGSGPDFDRVEMLRYLRANPDLARAVVFAVRPEDHLDAVYQLLNKLRKTHEKQLDPFHTLTAAICVVHDQELSRQINENEVKAPDPVALFDFFTDHEGQMLFGLKYVPTEMLVFVVDSTASIREMQWALNKYKGNSAVGQLFYTIKYDYNHYFQNTPKEVTRRGFNLPNILQYGGVCADQAYFASSVGKAIGVPTAYTVGQSSEIGHAWVGYLQAKGTRGAWNFRTGRYSNFTTIRGVVLDPQTGKMIPDALVGLTAELIGTKESQRQAAVAFTDAAARLMSLENNKAEFSPPPLLVSTSQPQASTSKPTGNQAANKATNAKDEVPPLADTLPRRPGLESELTLLEAGLRQSPGYAYGWFGIRELAKSGRMSLEQKRRWADTLNKLCGKDYPDFTLEILKPMVETVPDIEEQNALWETVFKMMGSRADLCAETRMAQAAMWEKAGDIKKAGKCYEDIINRYVNAGPFILVALEKTETLLRDSNQEKKIPLLYDQTWAKCEEPGPMSPEFRKQSNWYQVGRRYRDLLKDLDMDKQAGIVAARINKVMNSSNAERAAVQGR